MTAFGHHQLKLSIAAALLLWSVSASAAVVTHTTVRGKRQSRQRLLKYLRRRSAGRVRGDVLSCLINLSNACVRHPVD